MPKPIKRHKSLQPLSREHHFGLLLCWKIRTGLARNIEAERIKKYANWFFKNHLLPHFDMEEERIFPILGNEHEFTKRALQEHRRLKQLFDSTDKPDHNLRLIEKELSEHIRFEERILFNEIQKVATESQLHSIESVHRETRDTDPWEDRFWE